jgi:prepilin-type N-terminal cleavage/methylation domain-containing protein
MTYADPVRHRPLRRADGFTLIELLVVMTLAAVLVSIAVVGTRQARIRAAEAATVSALQAINQAQFTYRVTCGAGRYAPSLVALVSPVPGAESGFVSPDLGMSDPLEKSGYRFELSGTEWTDGQLTCTGLVPLDTYRLTADPLMPDATGRRFFGTNTDRVIYADVASFAEDMPETGPPGHGQEIR